MTTTAQTVGYPIQRATVQGDNPFFAAVNASKQPLPDSPSATFITLEAMASLVRGECPMGVSLSELPDISGYQDERIVNFAESLADGCLLEPQCEIERLFDYVAHQIKYLSHPRDQQTVQDAKRTIQFKTGDCVSKSVLLATLLAALGYPIKFIAQYSGDDTGYSHVYVLTQDENGQEIRLDPVASDKPMGWSQQLPDGGFETSWNIFRN